jgi:hypothetical protein
MKNNTQVKKIIEYLSEKISNSKEKIKEYEAPVMQDLMKSSPHLQYEYVRLKTAIEENENNLLVIEKFSGTPAAEEKPKQKKKRSSRKIPDEAKEK